VTNPTKYQQSYDFTGFQANNPNSPPPGVQIDIQLESIEQSIGQTVDALSDVRRSDGALQNGIVTQDSLSVGLVGQITTATAGLVTLAATARDDAQSAAADAAAAANTATVAADTLVTVADLAKNFYNDWGDFHTDSESTQDRGSVS